MVENFIKNNKYYAVIVFNEMYEALVVMEFTPY